MKKVIKEIGRLSATVLIVFIVWLVLVKMIPAEMVGFVRVEHNPESVFDGARVEGIYSTSIYHLIGALAIIAGMFLILVIKKKISKMWLVDVGMMLALWAGVVGYEYYQQMTYAPGHKCHTEIVNGVESIVCLSVIE